MGDVGRGAIATLRGIWEWRAWPQLTPLGFRRRRSRSRLLLPFRPSRRLVGSPPQTAVVAHRSEYRRRALQAGLRAPRLLPGL